MRPYMGDIVVYSLCDTHMHKGYWELPLPKHAIMLRTCEDCDQPATHDALLTPELLEQHRTEKEGAR